jgi:PAS domain S-box-containing protein
MKDKDKTKKQLINELAELRQRIAELEASETERKRVQEALRESEEKLRHLFESVTDGIFAMDLNGAYTEVNQRILEMHGLSSREEILGKSGFEFVAPRDIERTTAGMKEVLEQGTVVRQEFTALKADGSEFPVEVSGAVLKDASGNPVGLIGITRDITERKRAEAEREAARELLQATIDGVNEPIMLIGTDYQAKLMNQAVRDDYPVSKGTGPLYCYRVFHHRDTLCSGAAHPCPLEQVRQSLRPVTVVHEHVRLDGEKRLVEIIASPLMGENGTLTGIVESARDITESKRTEKALKEYSERLEEIVEERTRELRDAQEELIRKEKLAVLGQLAGGVGHELRNPLGAISNAIYFLNMALEEPESEVKEALEIMAKEVATSEKIISSLLDFARAKPPTRRKVDVNDVVQAALSRISVPENVQVMSQLDESLPTILADPDQLTQVFGNIILNGIQAMTSSNSVETPEGGRLVVKTFKTSEVSEKLPKSEGVAVSFADTGVGIPEENLDKLFEPLFTTKAKGIGLGLALVKTLVEGHRGSIEVQNAGEKGSTFTVRLPLDIERVVAVIERVREAR